MNRMMTRCMLAAFALRRFTDERADHLCMYLAPTSAPCVCMLDTTLTHCCDLSASVAASVKHVLSVRCGRRITADAQQLFIRMRHVKYMHSGRIALPSPPLREACLNTLHL